MYLSEISWLGFPKDRLGGEEGTQWVSSHVCPIMSRSTNPFHPAPVIIIVIIIVVIYIIVIIIFIILFSNPFHSNVIKGGAKGRMTPQKAS